MIEVLHVCVFVEANGIPCAIVRNGTNYLSFVSVDGRVHTAWLHAILVGELTTSDFAQIRKYSDIIFAMIGISVEVTMHFLDRVNAARNKKDITTSELTRLFKQSFKKYGKKIAKIAKKLAIKLRKQEIGRVKKAREAQKSA